MEAISDSSLCRRVKLIFNPGSGVNKESPIQLMDIINEMQKWNLVPEAFITQPDSDLSTTVDDAIAEGIDMFVVCGGDGTVSSVAKELYGKNATLGIIPTGTQNNVAFGLGIPKDIPDAIAILSEGRNIKIDVGKISFAKSATPFLEICSVGLLSTVFESCDDIQHGKLLRVGDFLSQLVSSPQAEFSMLLDNNKQIKKMGHVLLIANMPYVIRHYKVGSNESFSDGLLDVLFFDGLSKLDLVGYALKGSGTDTQEDPRIQHFRVQKIEVETSPSMPLMADGVVLGEGHVSIEVRKLALSVMASDSPTIYN